MAITNVNSGSSEQGSSSLTFVYTLPWSPAAGNSLYVFISGNNEAAGTTYSVKDSTNTTYTQDKLHKGASGLGLACGCYRRDNIPSGITTVTITCSVSTFLSIAVVEDASALSSGSFDVASAGSNGTSGSATPASYTPTTGDAGYTTMTHDGSASQTLTAGTAGWAVRTKQESTTGMPICVLENLSTSGAVNPATTIGGTAPHWLDVGTSFKVGVGVTETYPVPHQGASALLAM